MSKDNERAWRSFVLTQPKSYRRVVKDRAGTRWVTIPERESRHHSVMIGIRSNGEWLRKDSWDFGMRVVKRGASLEDVYAMPFPRHTGPER